MISITKEQISILAPNAAAAANGKKISQKGGFIKLYRSKDDTYIGGECKGSGKSNYVTSVDFINENAPVFRCSCPSRQFPCKHGLGLLFDYLDGKNFEECEVPQDILSKREKQAVRKEKKEQDSKQPKKVNKAAATKKMKKQLEGIEILDRFIEGVTAQGLASLSGTALKTYEDLAKQMGDYYLPGAQVLMRKLFLTVKEEAENAVKTAKLQKAAAATLTQEEPSDAENARLEEMLFLLLKLRAVSKKGKEFLSAKLEKDSVEPEESTIYENLGTIWQLSQLGELGLVKENARLLQLSFLIEFNEAKAEYADIGYWVDLENGVISKTENLRPVKALKHVKQDDTVLDVLKIPTLYYYPGDNNKRIRFDEFQMASVTTEDIQQIRSLAVEKIPEQLKRVKNQVKNVLSEQKVMALIPYDFLGNCEGETVLVQGDQKLCLKARKGKDDTVARLQTILPAKALSGQVLAGEYYYNRQARRYYVMPHSVILENAVIRLLY